ncbi:tyrosine-type recombinase/integrase [Paenibacillus sp. D51F]
MDTNPLINFKQRNDESRIVNIEPQILKRLIELPDKQTYTGLRDYALILLTLDTGIRPKEAFSLLRIDFNSTVKEVCISAENAKTRTTRVLHLLQSTVKAIKHLLSVHSEEWGIMTPIFCTYEGKTLNRHTWGDRLEVYSKQLGIHIRPYDLRHCFALNFPRNGANALVLQKSLGHTDLAMTKRYVALTQDDTKKEHEKISA